MRLFLAINLDHTIRVALASATEPLRAAAPMLAWTAEQKLHLTLRFLGEQDEAADARLKSAMRDVSVRHRAFPVQLRQVGAFPNFRRARVVWMGVEPAARLELLQHDVETACEAAGFGLDGRPFRPHVTLARVHRRPGEDVMRELARAARRVDFEAEAQVESIDVMHSIPSGGGTRYERRHALALAQGAH